MKTHIPNHTQAAPLILEHEKNPFPVHALVLGNGFVFGIGIEVGIAVIHTPCGNLSGNQKKRTRKMKKSAGENLAGKTEIGLWKTCQANKKTTIRISRQEN